MNIDIDNLNESIESLIRGMLQYDHTPKTTKAKLYQSLVETQGENSRMLKIMVVPLSYKVLDEQGVLHVMKEVKVSVSLAEATKAEMNEVFGGEPPPY